MNWPPLSFLSNSPDPKKSKITTTESNTNPEQNSTLVEIYGPPGLREFILLSMSLSESYLAYNYIVYELDFIKEFVDNKNYLPTNPEQNNFFKTSCDNILDANNPSHIQEIPIEKPIKLLENSHYLLSCETIGTGQNATKLSIYAYLEGAEQEPEYQSKMKISYLFTTSPKIGALDAKKLKIDGLPPGKNYALLKSGKTVEFSNKIFKPEDYISESKPGKIYLNGYGIFPKSVHPWLLKILSHKDYKNCQMLLRM